MSVAVRGADCRPTRPGCASKREASCWPCWPCCCCRCALPAWAGWPAPGAGAVGPPGPDSTPPCSCAADAAAPAPPAAAGSELPGATAAGMAPVAGCPVVLGSAGGAELASRAASVPVRAGAAGAASGACTGSRRLWQGRRRRHTATGSRTQSGTAGQQLAIAQQAQRLRLPSRDLPRRVGFPCHGSIQAVQPHLGSRQRSSSASSWPQGRAADRRPQLQVGAGPLHPGACTAQVLLRHRCKAEWLAAHAGCSDRPRRGVQVAKGWTEGTARLRCLSLGQGAQPGPRTACL